MIAIIAIPTNTATQLTGSVSDLFTDPGLLTLILVVAAIPFFFYVVGRLISLITDRDKKEFEKAERSVKEIGEKIKATEREYVEIGSALQKHHDEGTIFHQ